MKNSRAPVPGGSVISTGRAKKEKGLSRECILTNHLNISLTLGVISYRIDSLRFFMRIGGIRS